MLSFPFTAEPSSRKQAVADALRLHTIEQPDYLQHFSNVPDYVEVKPVARVNQAVLSVGENGEGVVDVSNVDVAIRFLNTKTGVDAWVRSHSLSYISDKNIALNAKLLGVDYNDVALHIWDEEYLAKHSSVLKNNHPNNLLSSRSMIEDQLKLERPILNSEFKKYNQNKMTQLLDPSSLVEKGEFTSYELAQSGVQDVFSGDVLTPYELDASAQLISILTQGLSSIPPLSEKVDGFIEELAQGAHKSMYNFILAGGDEDTMRNRAFLLKTFIACVNEEVTILPQGS